MAAMPEWIGFSALTAKEDVGALLRCAKEIGCTRKIRVGVGMSNHTLRGRPHPRHANRFVHVRAIPRLLTPHPLAFNCAHFTTDDPYKVIDQLRHAADTMGDNGHGMQINDVPWIDPVILRDLKRTHPQLYLILALDANAFRAVSYQPSALSRRLKEYEGLVAGTLLDASCGTGTPLDVDQCSRFLDTLFEHNSDMGHAIAGGMRRETLSRIIPIIRRHPDTSFDVETGVCFPLPRDCFDIGLGKPYLVDAWNMIIEAQSDQEIEFED